MELILHGISGPEFIADLVAIFIVTVVMFLHAPKERKDIMVPAVFLTLGSFALWAMPDSWIVWYIGFVVACAIAVAIGVFSASEEEKSRNQFSSTIVGFFLLYILVSISSATLIESLVYDSQPYAWVSWSIALFGLFFLGVMAVFIADCERAIKEPLQEEDSCLNAQFIGEHYPAPGTSELTRLYLETYRPPGWEGLLRADNNEDPFDITLTWDDSLVRDTVRFRTRCAYEDYVAAVVSCDGRAKSDAVVRIARILESDAGAFLAFLEVAKAVVSLAIIDALINGNPSRAHVA